jgi:hypothetical protein
MYFPSIPPADRFDFENPETSLYSIVYGIQWTDIPMDGKAYKWRESVYGEIDFRRRRLGVASANFAMRVIRLMATSRRRADKESGCGSE